MPRFEADEGAFIHAAANVAKLQLLKAIRPKLKEPIVPWLAKHVDLSFDATAAANGCYTPYPYQVAPLEAQEDPRVHHITLMMGQRLGKSTIWRMGLLKRVADGNCSAIVAYPSLELGLKQNNDTVKPLLTMLPEVKRDFAIRGNVKIDSYHSPSTSSVVYFMGAGVPLLSVTAGFLVADEVDFIELQKADDESKNTSQLKNLWLRGQTFPDRLMITVSSPTQYGGAIYQDWLKGSREIWHIRCLACGALIPANRLAFRTDGAEVWAGLQWEKNEAGQVIEESIRYICPHCRAEHIEAQAVEMNARGEYVAETPNASHRSFQCGALSNSRLWHWVEIAQAQEDATDTDGRKYLHNTVLGMPYKHVREGDTSVSIEAANRARQIAYPSDLGDRLEVVCAGVDQQKSELAGRKYFVSVVRGWDKDGNSWLLSSGIDESLDALQVRLDATYYGKRILVALIDHGGFDNADDVEPFVARQRNLFFYKGAAGKDLQGKDFVPSQGVKKLFLCNAVAWQVKLLDLLYSPKRPKGYQWWLPLEINADYIAQLCNVKPNTRMQKNDNGLEYANWAAFGGARRDYFDAEKMCLAALYIAAEYLPPQVYKAGHLPTFIAREKVLALVRASKKTNG